MFRPLSLLALAALPTLCATAQPASRPTSPPAKMPVREVTVFKDGHAFVQHQGRLPVDSSGNVVLDSLPSPVLGTFWPYSADPAVRLTAVTASRRRVQVERTALTLPELLQANPGAVVTVKEHDGPAYDATIVGVPEREVGPDDVARSPEAAFQPPQPGELVLLKTARGAKALPLARIRDLTFRAPHHTTRTVDEARNLLTMKLDWSGQKPEAATEVGMVYLQKGVRWIPGYRVSVDGKGNAAVKLQATLINELTDLSDATVNLVVGVPTFEFQGTPDPIGLQQTAAQLSPYFQQNSQTALGFSNGIMSQTAGEGRGRGANPVEPPDLGPEVGGTERSEDLFVFAVNHVTLGKGQRMVLPVAEYALKYQDVYTLELPFGPPREVSGNINSEQQAELARLLNRPKVMHRLRLRNTGPHPLTTAPALLVSGNRVLAQGLMTHTPVGAETDVPVTAAVDIRVRRSDVETGRKPDAIVVNGDHLTRIDLEGKVHLHNLRTEAVDLETTRYLLGQVGTADHDGKTAMIDPLDDDAIAASRPGWWMAYSWPQWWSRLNGIGRITWKVRVEPGKELDLGYRWHYFAP